jgi:hypothetical protein
MDRPNLISFAHLLMLQRRFLWRPERSGCTVRSQILADLVYSLAPIRYHPGIVQQAQSRSAETAVSPHHNNKSTIYK